MRRKMDPKTERHLTLLQSEVCTCGHTRLLHNDTLGGLGAGHGRCMVGGSKRAHCGCEKFSWAGRAA